MTRVVTWNLFHGRAVPPAGRPLLHEFAEALAGWAWDVALLQEAPPWWPAQLARACGAEVVVARTSRNAGLPLRRAIASRRPDLLKSNGGGCNAILVRPPLRIDAHAVRRLRIRPERRVLHAVRVAGAGVARTSGHPGPGVVRTPRHPGDGVLRTPGHPEHGIPGGARSGGTDGRGSGGDALLPGAWIGNVHTQRGGWDGGPGAALPLADLALAVETLERWAGPAVPVLLGGDLNLPRPLVQGALPAGWTRIATSEPDHVVARGLVAVGDSSRPARGALSDHAALSVEVAGVRCVEVAGVR